MGGFYFDSFSFDLFLEARAKIRWFFWETPKENFENNCPLLRLPLRPKLLPIIVLLLTRKLRYPGKMNGIVEKDISKSKVESQCSRLNLGKTTCQIILIVSFKIFQTHHFLKNIRILRNR